MLSFFDNELCSFGLLLGNLLVFDGFSEFATEDQVDDGNIIEDDVEVSQSFGETLPYLDRNLLSLSQQRSSIVLCNNRFQDLVDNGWKHSLIVVHAEISVDSLQFVGVWSVQHS